MKSLSKMNIAQRFVAKITDNHVIPITLRYNLIFINKMSMTNLPDGFKAYLVFENVGPLKTDLENIFSIPQDFNYLEADDIVVINP